MGIKKKGEEEEWYGKDEEEEEEEREKERYEELLHTNIVIGLNSPIKIDRLVDWIKKQEATICCLQMESESKQE
jgi:hypothetical protein